MFFFLENLMIRKLSVFDRLNTISGRASTGCRTPSTGCRICHGVVGVVCMFDIVLNELVVLICGRSHSYVMSRAEIMSQFFWAK